LARVARSARSIKNPTELARICHLSPPPSGVKAKAVNREEGAAEPHGEGDVHDVSRSDEPPSWRQRARYDAVAE
jgi:hypothetical protein